MTTALAVVWAASSLLPLPAPADNDALLRQLLTPGPQTCELLVPEKSPRTKELEDRFQAASRANKGRWLDDIVGAGVPPTPWRPSLGLTRKDHAELLSLYDEQPVTPVGTAAIRIGSRPKGVYVILGEVKDLLGLSISVPGTRVVTPFGECGPLEPVAPSEKQKRVGKWQGFQCTHEDGDPKQGASAAMRFSMGRLSGSGKLLIRYTGVQLTAAGDVTRADVFVQCGGDAAAAGGVLLEEPGYSVRMPGPFVKQEETVLPFVVRLFKTKVGERSYVAGYQENQGVKLTAQEALDAYQSGFVGKGELKQQDDIELAGYPGRQLHVSSKGVSHVARIYAVDQRIYLLSVVSLDGEVSFSEAERFFETFRLSDPPPPAAPPPAP